MWTGTAKGPEKSLRKPRAAAPYSGAALLAFPLALACLRGRISFFLRDRKSSSPVQRTITPTPASASPRSGAAVIPAYPLRSKPARTSAAENGYRLGKDAAFEEQHAVPQEERQDGASQISPADLSKDQDQGHTDQTCSKGSRHDLRTAMKKHLRSQSRQAGPPVQ